MKVLLLNRSLGSEILSDLSSCDTNPQDVLVVPDSAIVTRNRPVFLPLEEARFSAQAMVTYRIGRLGKNVAKKFAYRYIDALAPCCFLTVEGSRTPNLDCCLDGSLAIGPWIEIYGEGKVEDADQNLLHRPVRLGFFIEDQLASKGKDNAQFQKLELTEESIKISEAVKYLSRATTLKTGDIIIPATFTPKKEVVIGSQANVGLEVEGLGSSELRFRYK